MIRGSYRQKTSCALVPERLTQAPALFDSGVCHLLDHPVLHRVLRKLEKRAPLTASDREAVAALNFSHKTYEPSSYLAREGTIAEAATVILEGFAYRQKLTQDGSRQIVSVHVPGDFVDLENSLLKVADHNVQALTRCEVAAIPVRDVIALIDTHPRVGRALWVDTLIDASIYREWITNVGRRRAKQRLGHLLCEFASRMRTAGLGSEEGYRLPMTQEQLGDATGLTPVHVNRSLKALEAENLIVRRRHYVGIPDWDRLRQASDFSELYLHLDQEA
jgi:CRP-like cAMP-binding protein